MSVRCEGPERLSKVCLSRITPLILGIEGHLWLWIEVRGKEGLPNKKRVNSGKNLKRRKDIRLIVRYRST